MTAGELAHGRARGTASREARHAARDPALSEARHNAPDTALSGAHHDAPDNALGEARHAAPDTALSEARHNASDTALSEARHNASDTAPPARSWNPEVLDGPLSVRALLRVDEALRQADASTGLTFSVYIGDLAEPTREHAENLLAALEDPDNSVLMAVSPNQRVLEIVTGASARLRVLDRDCKLAALSMAAAFTGGDLGGGIVTGLAQLAGHAGSPTRR